MPVEVIYRDRRTPEQFIRNELDNNPASGMSAQTKVTMPSTRTTTTIYNQGFQTHPMKPSLLNE
jgi:hypothetical protein